jgi:hypothetical protein
MGMSDDNQNTQPIPTRAHPRYIVEVNAPSFVFVRDTWLNQDVRTFYVRGQGHTLEGAKLSAETAAAEMNAPATALEFVSRLANWLSEGRDAEVNPGDLCEDMDRLLEHYIGQLRGVQREPLRQEMLYHPAPWINQ